MNKDLVVVGISGLDLDLLNAKLHSGVLPALAKKEAAGKLSPLVSPVPPSSVSAWASIVTGVLPERHGMFLPDEPWEGGVRQSGHASWRFAPAWERLAEAGIPTASVCWPATRPGATWEGTHVDPRYLDASGLARGDWPLPQDVAPLEFREALRHERVHPADLPNGLATPLMSPLDHPGNDVNRRAIVALARAATLRSAMEIAIAHANWRVLFVYIDLLEAIGTALRCAPAALPNSAWALVDQLLSMLPTAADALILSPGGLGPGFVLETGTDVPSATPAWGRSTLAIAPTIYQRFGLGDRSLGAALHQTTERLRELPSGNRDKQEAAPHPGDHERLAAFAPLRTDVGWQQRRLLAEAETIIAHDPTRAAMLAEQANKIGGDTIVALGLLAAAAVAQADVEPLEAIGARIAAIDPGHPWHDLTRAAAFVLVHDEHRARPHLIRSARSRDPDDLVRTASLWLMLDRRYDAAKVFRDLLQRSPHHLGALLGLLSTQTVQGFEAETLLRRALMLQPYNDAVRSALAELLRSQGRHSEAEFAKRDG